MFRLRWSAQSGGSNWRGAHCRRPSDRRLAVLSAAVPRQLTLQRNHGDGTRQQRAADALGQDDRRRTTTAHWLLHAGRRSLGSICVTCECHDLCGNTPVNCQWNSVMGGTIEQEKGLKGEVRMPQLNALSLRYQLPWMSILLDSFVEPSVGRALLAIIKLVEIHALKYTTNCTHGILQKSANLQVQGHDWSASRPKSRPRWLQHWYETVAVVDEMVTRWPWFITNWSSLNPSCVCICHVTRMQQLLLLVVLILSTDARYHLTSLQRV